MGEYGVSLENMENIRKMTLQDGKHQPVDLKQSIYQTDDSKRSILLHPLRRLIKS